MNRMSTLLTLTLLSIAPTLNFAQSAGGLAHKYDPSQFSKKITLTHDGLQHFAGCYNHPEYTSRFLPTCLLHVGDLLEPTKTQEDPYTYATTILGMFHQRIKTVRYQNPYAIAQLLDMLPELLRPVLCPQNLEILALSDVISKQCREGRAVFENNPQLFIDSLTEAVHAHNKSRKSIGDVQSIAIRFVESMLDKLVWDAKDDIYTWKCFKVIGSQLETLYQKGIVPDADTLNQLVWSLVSRFSYFIELSGSGLSLDVYGHIKNDLANGAVPVLQLEEPETFILPKAKVLAESARFGETKARLYPRGVITDSVL